MSFFAFVSRTYWWAPLLMCPVAGALIIWLMQRFSRGADGSGIPQVMAALRPQLPLEKTGFFVSIRIAIGKVVLGVMGLAAGFSAGREGPSVQVAASIMHAFHRFLPEPNPRLRRSLILAGGAAGIAAAFNTPLAGVVFAIEELGKRVEDKTNGVLISAIVLAGLISISVQGNYTYFGRLVVTSVDYRILWPVLVCGVVCGVAGGLFSRLLIAGAALRHGRLGWLRHAHPCIWAALCGLAVALLGLVSHGAAHGSGYLPTQDALGGTMDMAWYYAPVKFAATVLTFLSGIPGGIFAPSLAVGTGIGADLRVLFDSVSPLSVQALCMAAFLAAVTQSPLTAFIIVMEMIDGHEMVISLMAVAMIASLISRVFSRPLYSALADLQWRKLETGAAGH
jgi:H+/Cl- antiporter ClcA